MIKTDKVIVKFIIQIVLSMILALGVAGVAIGGLGLSDIDVFSYYLMKITYSKIGMELGTWTAIVNILIAVILFLITRNKKLFLSVIFVFFIGVFIDLWVLLFESIFSLNLAQGESLQMMNKTFLAYVISIPSLVLIALGVALIAVNDGVISPYDELALLMETKMKHFFLVKIILDGGFMLMGLIIALITNSVSEQFGPFSIVIIVVIGPMIHLFLKLFRPKEVESNKEELALS